jgi:hypothetical protein
MSQSSTPSDNRTVLLSSILKLCNGDKERCYQLIQQIRAKYPNKSMHWHLQKVIYDLRWNAKKAPPPPPNPILCHPERKLPSEPLQPMRQGKDHHWWGVKGVVVTAKTQPEQPIVLSKAALEALAKTKRKIAEKSQPASEVTKRKLFKLTGNWEVSQRLVARIRFNNPDRSEQWAYEKAIYDLERDRLRH